MTSEQKEKIVTTARSLLGKPYHYGAHQDDAPNTFDCSSFTQYILKAAGIEIPRSSILQAGEAKGEEIKPSADFSNLETGDLLFMRSDRGHYYDELFGEREISIGHVALYIGDGEVIHARKKLGGVVIQKLAELVAEPHYGIVFVKRF